MSIPKPTEKAGIAVAITSASIITAGLLADNVPALADYSEHMIVVFSAAIAAAINWFKHRK